MSDPVRFIHLRTHTEYSLLEGAVPVKKLVGLCAAQNMPAVAVTDSNAMFAALEFSTIAENTVSGSGAGGAGDGIRIEGGATANPGNRVQFNTISGSANHDCHDATTGGGTAGTDSFWAANGAATQNVANLCFTGAANGVAD